MEVEIEYDPIKDLVNIAKHGISLTRSTDMDDQIAVIERDARDYGDEIRYRAYGPIDDRIYVLIFTMRGNKMRPISLRKANTREQRYVQTTKR
jgi:uncharacterized DUF497 family protein